MTPTPNITPTLRVIRFNFHGLGYVYYGNQDTYSVRPNVLRGVMTHYQTRVGGLTRLLGKAKERIQFLVMNKFGCQLKRSVLQYVRAKTASRFYHQEQVARAI